MRPAQLERPREISEGAINSRRLRADSISQRRAREFADEPDLSLETNVELFLNGILSDRDQLSDIFGGGTPEIDHDVGVNV